jgi:hypothetical protein
MQANPRAWPCWFDVSDTSGEKECEEFEYPDAACYVPVQSIKVAMQTEPDYHALTQARTRLLAIAREEEWSKEAIAETIRIAVPELVHIEKNRSLDDKL